MTYSDVASYFNGLDESRRNGAMSAEMHRRRNAEFITTLINSFGRVLDDKTKKLIDSRRSM